MHGGAFRLGSTQDNVPLPYLAEGYAVASINYRMSKHALFPAQVQDCKAAVRWPRANAEQFSLDPHRNGAWGESAGGYLVTMLSTTSGTNELTSVKTCTCPAT